MSSILSTIISALQLLIFVDAILSFVMPDSTKFPRNFTTQITDPLYAPIRAVLRPEKMGIDISPMIVLMLLEFMRKMLLRSAGF
jgi:uncharacterized protein YggT (Ycf19 family)